LVFQDLRPSSRGNYGTHRKPLDERSQHVSGNINPVSSASGVRALLQEGAMLKESLIIGSATLVLLAGVGYAQQSPLQPPPIKRTPLGKVDVPGSNYEVVFAIAELAPNLKTGRHSHPGPLLVYVAEGEFWYHIDGQPEKIYKAGDSFPVSDGAIHNEGAIGSGPAKLMAVYIVEKGKPMVQPAK
jgi:quercetin dioxygenase-like cupin family protein